MLWLGVILGPFFVVFFIDLWLSSLSDLFVDGQVLPLRKRLSAGEHILATLLVGSPLIIVGLIVTWKWFGSRPSKS